MNLSYHCISLESDKLTCNQQKIKKAKTALEVFNIVDRLTSETLVLIDIDDTILTPVSTTFRAAPYNQMIDIIKKNKSQYPNFDGIISNWRLQRKTMLLDTQWPEVLRQMREKYSVYGLTKLDTGRFGNISSMEQWRYEELKTLGIEFTLNSALSSALADYPLNSPESNNRPIYYNGLLMTGSATKSQTLKKYQHFLKCKTLVMVDDRLENLDDVSTFCTENSINYVPILFDGLRNFTDKPDPEIADFQKNHLIVHAQWLEDREAANLIQQKRTDKLPEINI